MHDKLYFLFFFLKNLLNILFVTEKPPWSISMLFRAIYDWLSVLSMSHKRSLLSCHVTNRSGLKNAQKLTAAVNLLKSQFETKQIDSITFVKLIALNLMTASKKRCQKRSKSIIDSIKNKYKNKVTGIVNRLGM